MSDITRRPFPKTDTIVVCPQSSPFAQYADYVTTGSNDDVTINAALTKVASYATNGRVLLREGNYILSNSISIPDTSAIQLVGMGMNVTYLTWNKANFSAIQKTSPTTARYKLKVSDLTLDNTAKTNAGAIGLDMMYQFDSDFERVLITNFETAVKVWGQSYFLRFYRTKVEECTNGFLFTRDPDATAFKPNENTLNGCGFTKASGGTGVEYPINIQYGNDNHFINNSCEDFLIGVESNDIGNNFTNNRIECNDRGTVTHVQLDSSSANNQFMGNYYSGNGWGGWSTSIIDNGAGNAFIENNTFKDQRVIMHRNLNTAGEYLHYYRDGTGDAAGLLIAEDTYANSGSPIQFIAKGVRAGGKFFQGLLSNVEKAYIDANGNFSGTDLTITTPSSTSGHVLSTNGTQNVTNKTLQNLFMNRSAQADTGHTLSASDMIVPLTSITSSRTFTLPAPAAGNTNEVFVIKDESNSLTTTVTLTISVSGGTAIDNNKPSIVLNSPGAYWIGYSDGTYWRTIALSNNPFPQDAGWTPWDNASLLTWSYDPVGMVNNYNPTAKLVFGSTLILPVTCSVTNVIVNITSAGANLQNCFVALYDSSKNLIAKSADQSTPFQTTGVKTIALASGPYTVTAGKIYAVAWEDVSTGSTFGQFGRGAGNNGPNANLASSASRFFTADTGIGTTAPSSLGTFTSLASSPWFALS